VETHKAVLQTHPPVKEERNLYPSPVEEDELGELIRKLAEPADQRELGESADQTELVELANEYFIRNLS